MAKKNVINKCCENCGCLDKSRSEKKTIGERKLLFYGCSNSPGGCSLAFSLDGKCDGCCGRWEATQEEKAKNKSMAKELGGQIKESFERWRYISIHGASDPAWEDGCNMNLVRNHILYGKRQCEALLLPEDYPEEYFLETPPEVNDKYMARVEEIRERSKKSLEAYKADSDYRFILQAVNRLTKQQNEQTHASAFLRYVSGLEDSIQNDKLVEMRRHESPDRYLDSFRECRKRIEEILGKPEPEPVLPMGQLSLFDLYGLT